MTKSGFKSLKISTDRTLHLKDVTSLTISNYGAFPITVIVDDVARPVPPFKEEIGVPFGSFNIPGDGTACSVSIQIKFNGNGGNAIIDYRLYKPQEC